MRARFLSGPVLAVVLVACGPAVVSPAPASPTLPSPSPLPPSSVTPSAVGSAGAVPVDLALLDVLPSTVDGVELMPDPETAAELAGLTLPPEITSLAVGLYVDPNGDLAVVNVVGLEPGSVTDAWFRQWRDTYDASACEVAGGLEPGHAETEIEGHRTFIGTCVQGAHTYHVHLDDPDRVVSINAVGDGRLGEHVVAGLAE